MDYPVKGPKFHKHGFEGNFEQPEVKITELVNFFTDIRPTEHRDGFNLIIHDPYEVPSDQSKNIFTMANQTVEYLINPIFVTFDEEFRTFELKS